MILILSSSADIHAKHIANLLRQRGREVVCVSREDFGNGASLSLCPEAQRGSITIDGHDVRALREALREALAAERPVVVHVATVKGKGFAPAEDGGLEGMEKWHAAKPHSILNGVPTAPPPSSPVSCRRPALS